MQTISLDKFQYNPKYKWLFSTTRECGSVLEGDILIEGQHETKIFKCIGGDETYDTQVGECMCYHYRSECGQFSAQINLVT